MRADSSLIVGVCLLAFAVPGCGSDDSGGGSGGSATGGTGGAATGGSSGSGTGGSATGGSAGSSSGGNAGSGTGGTTATGGAGGTSGSGGSAGDVGCMNIGLSGDSAKCSCVYPKTPITAGIYKDPACTVTAATKCCFKAFHKTFNTNICMCLKGDTLTPCSPSSTYNEGWTTDPSYENITDATSCPP